MNTISPNHVRLLKLVLVALVGFFVFPPVALWAQTPTVTITASDADASELGTNTGTFTVTRNPVASTLLTVNLSRSGTATIGADYMGVPGGVYIPADQASVTFTLTPLDDAFFEPDETVIVAIATDPHYSIGTPGSATVTIHDNDGGLSTVTVSSTPIVSEFGVNPGVFTVTRTRGDQSGALVVNYSTGGTATSALDYRVLSGSVTIPGGASSARVTVSPVDDSEIESNETVVLRLSANAAYTLGAPSTGTVMIGDNDATIPMVTISTSDPAASELGLNTGTFTITRYGRTAEASVVNYIVTGTATSGGDYVPLPGSVTIPVGSISAIVTVTPLDDATIEGNETVVATLAANAAYVLVTPDSASLTIGDNDGIPIVTISATDPDVAENGSIGTLTVRRAGGSTTTAITVHYTVSGTATSGSDFFALSGSVTLPENVFTVGIGVKTIVDSTVESNESVIVTLSPNAAYIVGLPNSGIITIADNDASTPSVTVNATDPNASEPGLNLGTFTLTRTGNTGVPLTVSYTVSGSATATSDYAATLSGSATIFPGESFASIGVIPIDDPETEANETVIVTIIPGANYIVGSPGTATVTIADDDPMIPGAPRVTIVAPKSGPTIGNHTINIFGEGFSPEATVRLGGVTLTGVIYKSDKHLAGTTGPHPSGLVDVEVDQTSGSFRLSNAYTYKLLNKVVPPIPDGAGTTLLRIPFVTDTAEFRTNLGINNLGDDAASVNLSMVENNGLLISQKPLLVPGHGMVQINNVGQFLEDEAVQTWREAYLIVEGSSNVQAWASQIDNVSRDPSMQLARPEAASRILLPSSVSNSRFLTSLLITSHSPLDGAVNIILRNSDGETLASLSNRPLPAFGYLFFDDFYQSLGLDNAFGPIEIEGLNGLRIVATERIYTRENTSAYFEGVDSTQGKRRIVLPYSVESAEFRTNLGINNLVGVAANVFVKLVGRDGNVLGALNTIVPPRGLSQLNNINRLLTAGQAASVEGTLQLEADQDITAWSSQIDNITQDPSFVVAKSASGPKLLIPSTTSVGNFRSSLVVVNLDEAPTTVEIKLRDNDGSPRGVITELISGRGFFSSTDIHARLQATGNFGPLEITSLDGKQLLAVSRVSSDQGTGGYFEGLP